MQEKVQNLKNEAIAQILEAGSLEEIENIRINYLGRQGKLTALISEISKIDKSERKQVGMLINDIKTVLLNTLSTKKNKLKEPARKWFDASIPGLKPQIGHLHLITQAIDEISRIFENIGFVRSRYPEVEWDWFAFGSLNFDKWHPARDEWETFIVDEKPHPKFGQMVLTPHTSSGQVREMNRVLKPPVRMINIAKCYRRQSDASHYPMFHQFEGLVADKDINITNLKGTLDYFAQSFFGPERKTRIRPYNFPFTEPSFEVDVNCGICNEKADSFKNRGCKLCKEGWLEMGGSGMVHPNVLKNGGIDPDKYSGFAFGWGVERALMMKPGINIPDLRLLYSTDIRYLKQF